MLGRFVLLYFRFFETTFPASFPGVTTYSVKFRVGLGLLVAMTFCILSLVGPLNSTLQSVSSSCWTMTCNNEWRILKFTAPICWKRRFDFVDDVSEWQQYLPLVHSALNRPFGARKPRNCFEPWLVVLFLKYHSNFKHSVLWRNHSFKNNIAPNKNVYKMPKSHKILDVFRIFEINCKLNFCEPSTLKINN